MDVFREGLSVLTNPAALALLVAGIVAGILAGALPGLTSTMSMALLVPFSWQIHDQQAALCLLFGLYVGAMHGGAVSAILIGTPGTPAAAATVFDGYPMARRGQALLALNISTAASTIGGLLSTLVLISVAPELAHLAREFGYHEFFLLAVLGLFVIASVSGASLLKGLAAGFFGLLLAAVGRESRFLFAGPLAPLGPEGAGWVAPGDHWPLATLEPAAFNEPLPFIPIMIGVFAIAEALAQLPAARRAAPVARAAGTPAEIASGGGPLAGLARRAGALVAAALTALARRAGALITATPRLIAGNFVAFARTLPLLRRLLPVNLGASVIGTVVGAIPGTGGDIASFVAYDQAKRWSKEPQRFGAGAPQGLAAAETANNAVTGGAMIPVLALGIPGDAVTAILLIALRNARLVSPDGLEQRLKVGPHFMESGALLIGTLFVGLLAANALALPVRLVLTPLFSKVIELPRHLLWPAVTVFCLVGSYALGTEYALDIMLVFGVVGGVMKALGFPPGPLVLGLILGPIAEENLRNALLVDEGAGGFLTRPVCAGLLGLFAASLLWRTIRRRRRQ